MNSDSKILITGAKSYVGTRLGIWLSNSGFSNVHGLAGTKQGIDLGQDSDLGWAFDMNPEVVVHLATRPPSKTNSLDYPAGLMYENILVTSRVMEEARLSGCKKFISLWDSCCYPDIPMIPFKESDLWDGSPHWTKRYYGNSARAMMEMSMAFATQFPDIVFVNLIAPEIYGPYSDFNPNKNKIIENAISNIRAAQNANLDIDISGQAKITRDFLFITDALSAIEEVIINVDQSSTYNISEGSDYSIKSIHEMLAEICEFENIINWEEGEEIDVQKRSCLNTNLIQKETNWKPRVTLKEGLAETIKYHDENLVAQYLRHDSIIEQR